MEQLIAVHASMAELKKLDENDEFGSLEIVTENVKDEDWSEIWKQYFHPIPIGEKILICPAWEVPEDGGGRTQF